MEAAVLVLNIKLQVLPRPLLVEKEITWCHYNQICTHDFGTHQTTTLVGQQFPMYNVHHPGETGAPPCNQAWGGQAQWSAIAQESYVDPPSCGPTTICGWK